MNHFTLISLNKIKVKMLAGVAASSLRFPHLLLPSQTISVFLAPPLLFLVILGFAEWQLWRARA
jgi:hypothetical protein